jgi:hypothetical protein
MDHLTLDRDNVQQIENHWFLVMFTHVGYHEVSKLIMGCLSASDVAALHAALKIKPSESVRRHYLHPLRDVDPTMRMFQSWFRDDCQILMIGPDTLLLKERIRNPEAYCQHYRGRKRPQLETWAVGIPPTSKSDHLKRLKRINRLKRKWNNHQNDQVVRAAALVALEDIFNRDILRQCLCLYDHNKPDHNELDVDTLVGESILVKYFDLFDCSDVLSSGLVGLSFLGMQFRLPWNINKPYLQGIAGHQNMACLISIQLTSSVRSSQLPIAHAPGGLHAKVLERGMLLLFSTVTIRWMNVGRFLFQLMCSEMDSSDWPVCVA